ncbi:MAG TPA: tetratricopeptide repeat protein [Candidatus Saccharimonadia bacterium]|nr:tetratricopeptide repeat protein [Candidatus Saccharimonadia bacterium]
MALEMMDEHEQSEFVRNWLRQNLNAILIGIAVGIAGLIGWNQWKAMKVERAGQAQGQYAALVAAYEAKDADAIDKIGAELRGKFDRTPYAVFAALRDAQHKLEANDAKGAAESLDWAREHAELEPIRDLATLRLARVRLAGGEAQAALDLAAGVGTAYKAMAAETRGDALLALGRTDEAGRAYEEALTALDATSPRRAFVEMKRDDAASPATGALATQPAVAKQAEPS